MFENVTQAVEFLEARHKPGRYAYRGQELRYSPHVFVDGAGTHHTLESVYPGDYRFILEYGRHSPALPDKVAKTREASRNRRDRFARFLAGHLDPGAAWLEPHAAEVEQLSSGSDNVGDLEITKLAWSLAQYYRLSTSLLDITFDPRVAGWFATRPWDGQATFQASGNGVIYRFDVPRLERLLAEVGGGSGSTPGFVVNLESIPASFAARPARQRGGSVCGFDRLSVIDRAFEERIAEPFEFRQGFVATNLGVGRADLVPAEDPFLPLAREFEKAAAAH